MNGLEGKVAIVTGGNSGFGQATSLAFARRAFGLRSQPAPRKRPTRRLRIADEAGSKGVFIPTDLTETSQVEALVARTVEVFGRLDFAVNIAGIARVIAPGSVASAHLVG